MPPARAHPGPRTRAPAHPPTHPPAQLLGDLLDHLPAGTLVDLLGQSEGEALGEGGKAAGQGGVMAECKQRCGLAA